MPDTLEPDETGAGPSSATPTAPLDVADQPASSSSDSVTQPRTPPAAAGSGTSRVLRAIDRGPQTKPWRILSIVLLVLGCVLAPIGLTASWAKNLVVNEDAYLAAVDPLVTNPVIIGAAENRAVDAINNAIDSLQLADKLSDELVKLGLPPKLAALASTYAQTLRGDITNAITDVVHKVFTSEDFQTIWTKANAKAHSEFVTVMQGQESGKLHTINVDVSSAVATVKKKLESSGVSWASQIPDIPVVINLAGNADVQQLQGYYDLLNTLGTWLPILALVFLLLSVLIAPSRIRGLFHAALWLAVSMVVLVLGLLAGRAWLVNQAPSQPDVTKAFVAQLTVGLQGTIRLVLIVSIVIAVVAWLLGPTKASRSLRSSLRRLVGQIEDSRWHLAVQVTAGVVAIVLVLVLISMDDPSLLAAVILAVLAVLFGVVAASPARGRPAVAPAPVGDIDARHDVVASG